MVRLRQWLRQEHEVLRLHLEQLCRSGDEVGKAPEATLRQELHARCMFLVDQLLAQVQAEEQVLYPMVAQILETPHATAALRHEHVEVGRLANDLRGLCAPLCAAPWRPEQVQDFRRVVSILHALLTEHWTKEEELYSRLPNSKLTAAAAHGLQVAMQMVQAVASQPHHQLTADSAQ